MGRKIVWFTGVVLLSFAFAGCNNGGDRPVDTENNIVGEIDGKELPKPTQAEEWISVDVKDETKAFALPAAGMAFGELQRIGSDNEYYCNLVENIALQGGTDPSEQARSLVCLDPVYEITYYVNCGRDYYIYGIKDGINYRIAEIPATDLYCRDGILYFLLKGYGKYVISKELEGTVFCYNPADGQIRQVTSQQGDSIQVYPDGIVINKVELVPANEDKTLFSQNACFWFHDFENNTTLPLELQVENLNGKRGSFSNPDRIWGNFMYSIAEKQPEESEQVQRLRALGYTGDYYSVEKILLLNRQNSIQGELKNCTAFPAFCRISGDELYYVGAQEVKGRTVLCLMSYSIPTGETKVVFELALQADGLFTVIGNVCYFAGCGYRVSMEDGEQDYLEITELQGMGPEGAAFYTDGKRIFLFDGSMLWEYREKPANGGIAVTDPVSGNEYRKDGYQYELLEVGENYLPE